uniref:ATP-dependent RNA helicase DHX30-like n=1 Tax=Saccoglossus kowalevskii TaxID=10224 RepID=A0ABM0MCE0_SACKO|nr:PREDICTED: putative ATP-dependent RNA helicase DHX30-like [Saccoglossus kowalevskii]
MCQITLQYPEEFQVVGHGRRKSEAENVAAAVACAKLMDYGVLDEKLRPVMPEYGVYSQMQIREFVRRETLPMWLRIDEELQNDITNALDNWKSCNVRQDLHEDTVSNDVIDNSTDNEDMYKMREYLSEEDLDRLLWKSDTMRQHLEFLENDESLSRKKMRESVAKLPILAMRSEIYSAIENNQVIVLEGDTGCGKTTQVPQIILDEYIRNGRGAHCNIVVTQPRRISAVSIAERVSDERAERVGQTVGYQVRLENRLPEKDGSVLFCTVGILLKKIQSNPSLNGVTHVIVDEVHERDVNTDFLLILLKELVQKNSDIKIILMSASINTHMFSKYFNNCPIISVPGLMYPVKEYFLEDVFRMVGDVQRRNGNGRPSFDKPDTNWEMVSRVIEYIDTNKPHGAILCFLPGWQDIVAVRNRLQELWPSQDLHWIFPVHSSVPMSQQQAIFEKPPEGVRKVVLATNIAETSITINDVVYVVNVGNHKELRYNIETGTSCLDVHWISRANVRQRKGRAGRCQPGECYHLFTENKLQDMDDFQLAEMLRVPLEQLIVQTKIHTPHTIVAEFLEKALEPPSEDAVEKAVDLLQDLDILDDDENLTPLGKKISHITTDPRLAKAIVYSAIFRCVDPILTISASLSSRDPYMDSLERRSEVNLVKRRFSGNSKSDHIGLLNVFSEWLKFSMHNRHDGRRFAMDNILHHGSLNFIKGLRRQFSENLYDAGMVNFEKSGLMYVDGCNENSDDQELIKGVLAAALYPNIVYVRRGEIINDKLKLNSVICKDLDNNRIILHPSSVNSDEKKFPHRWLTYFTKTKSSGTFIRDSSMVHPMVLICLAGKSLCVLPVRKSEGIIHS